MLGNGRLEAMCIDSTKRLCHIRGKMRKKVWVNTVSTELALLSSSLIIWSSFCLWSQQLLQEPRISPCCHLNGLCPDVQGDIILVGLRDYQDEKADVILKCDP